MELILSQPNLLDDDDDESDQENESTNENSSVNPSKVFEYSNEFVRFRNQFVHRYFLPMVLSFPFENFVNNVFNQMAKYFIFSS